MMYLIMTAGIMGLCLFLVSRLSRACGLHLKGRALALAGVFATSIALLLPVFAPFLTRGYYWKLGGLVFLAAALVTAYNAHLLKRDAARDGETAHAAESPANAAAEAEDIPAPPPLTPQASAPEAAGLQAASPEAAEPQGAPQAAPTEDAATPAPAEASLAPALQETAEMASPKPEAEPEAASDTEDELLPPEQKPVLVPASKGGRASAPTPAAPAAVPEAAVDAPAPDASTAPDMATPAAKSARQRTAPPPQADAPARALPTEARTTPESPQREDTPPVADAPAKEPAAAGTAPAPPPANAAPPRHTIFSRRPADAEFADELAALSSLDAFLDYAYAAQQRREFPRALAAYREALRQYTDDPYVPYLFIDLGNLCKQQARYEDCIEVYREGLRLPIIAGNEAMAEEFRKNLLYLCLVYNILKKHQALATPFSEIPQTYRAEIETAYQAKLAMHPGS